MALWSENWGLGSSRTAELTRSLSDLKCPIADPPDDVAIRDDWVFDVACWLCVAYDDAASREGTKAFTGDPSKEDVAYWLTETLGMCASTEEALNLFVKGEGRASDDFLMELTQVVRALRILNPETPAVDEAGSSAACSTPILSRMEDLFASAPPMPVPDTVTQGGEGRICIGEEGIALQGASTMMEDEGSSSGEARRVNIDPEVGARTVDSLATKVAGDERPAEETHHDRSSPDSFWATMASNSTTTPLGETPKTMGGDSKGAETADTQQMIRALDSALSSAPLNQARQVSRVARVVASLEED